MAAGWLRVRGGWGGFGGWGVGEMGGGLGATDPSFEICALFSKIKKQK